MRILLLCSRPPWPLKGGDRIRTWHLARALAELGPVDLVATRAAHEDPAEIASGLPFIDRMRLPVLGRLRPGLRVGRALVGGACLQQALYNSAGAQRAIIELEAEAAPDLVVAHLVRTVPWLDALQSNSVSVLVDIQDALSAQYRESRGRSTGWRGWAMALEERRVAEAERDAVRRADGVTFISARDAAAVDCGTTPVAIAGAAFLGAAVAGGPSMAPVPGRIGFLGNLRTASNRDMAVRFARETFPSIREQRPDATFRIFGVEAPAEVRELGGLPGVTFVGEVEDVGEALSSCWLTVCPQRFGSGVQNKVIESLAHGSPALISPSAAEGFGVDGPFVVAGLGPEFVDAALRLLNDSDFRSALAARGPAWVDEHHRPAQALAGLLAMARCLGSDFVGSASEEGGAP